MATHQLAKGLASLGRHGDSMLMHVSPAEVSGLQALGEMTGSRLHTNPDTGLPEAFDFGDFFSSLLPTLVGIGLSPATGGASLGLTGMTATAAPILGGMATGALVAGAKGQDVLGGALMGGLGGYGGGNLGSSLAKLGGGVNPATSNIQLSTLANGGGSAGIPQSALNSGITDFGLGSASSTPSQGVQLATNTMNTSPVLSDQYSTLLGADKSAALASGQPISTVGSGAKGGFDSLMTGAGKFASDPFGQFDAFKEAGGSAMQIGAPLAMATLSGMQPEPYDFAADEEKRKAEENKYRDPITGNLNLSPSSGLNLGIPSFATGGTINTNRGTISGGGIQDLYGARDDTGTPSLSQDGYGLGRLNSLVSAGANARAADEFYAQGGPVSFADGGQTITDASNLENLPSLNLNIIGKPSEDKQTSSPSNPFEMSLRGLNGMGLPNAGMGSLYHQMLGVLGKNAQLEPKSYALNVNTGKQEAQYAHGGYLNGNGDGMSDSIPATIEGKQPARLADGEFVVPADVVSHIGNGSSKAGSKRLYAMLDKVRKARTGHTKQGKQINPSKYMPA
jgi:hypothetical protein